MTLNTKHTASVRCVNMYLRQRNANKSHHITHQVFYPHQLLPSWFSHQHQEEQGINDNSLSHCLLNYLEEISKDKEHTRVLLYKNLHFVALNRHLEIDHTP